MSQTQSLFPCNAKNVIVAGATTASTSAALPAAGDTIHFFNEGPNNAWVSVGTGARVATLPVNIGTTPTNTCWPVPAGAVVTYGIPEDLTTNPPTPLNISAITRTGTAVINVAVNRGC